MLILPTPKVGEDPSTNRCAYGAPSNTNTRKYPPSARIDGQNKRDKY